MKGLFGEYRPLLFAVLVFSISVLLGASTTLGVFLIGHLHGRRTEFRIRAALGASSGALTTQLMLEVVLLASAACVAAVWAAYMVCGAVVAWIPDRIYGLVSHGIDRRALVFSVSAALACSVAAGAWPIFTIRRTLSATELFCERRSHGFAGHFRASHVLLAWQVAVAVALCLVSAKVFLTLRHFETERLGIKPDSAAVITMQLTAVSPADRFFAVTEALRRLRSLPEVIAAGTSTAMPLSDQTPEYLMPSDGAVPGARLWRATSGYFAAAGIPVLHGREFTEDDERRGGVTIVTASFARLAWPDKEAVGQVVSLGYGYPPALVIGVVGDTRSTFHGEDRPSLFLPENGASYTQPLVLARVGFDDEDVYGRIRTAVTSDGRLAARVRPLQEMIGGSLRRERFQVGLSAGWSLFALALAVLCAFITSLRTVTVHAGEVAIRLALGAPRRRLAVEVLRGSLVSAAVGASAGLGLYALADRLVAIFFRGVLPMPESWIVAILIGVVSTVIAGCATATLRLLRIHPAALLRSGRY